MRERIDRLKLCSVEELEAMQWDALDTVAAVRVALTERAQELATDEALPFRNRLANSALRSFKAAALKQPFRVGLAMVIAIGFLGMKLMELFGAG